MTKRLARAIFIGMGRSIDLFGIAPTPRLLEAKKLSQETGCSMVDSAAFLDWLSVGDDLRGAMIAWKEGEADVQKKSRRAQASS